MKSLKKIGALKLTLVLLLILAAVSMIGIVIPQSQTDDFYIDRFGVLPGKAILFLNVDDLYNGIFYTALLVGLGLNLLVCSLNSYSRIIFKERRKLGLFLLHCGIMIVFFGALITKFTRHSQYYTLFPGDKISLPGEETELILKEFNIEYYPQMQQPREYRSRFDLLEKGVSKKECIVRVNHPLYYGSVAFYQSSFEVSADVDIIIRHMKKVIWQGVWEHNTVLNIPGHENLNFKIKHFLPDARVDSHGHIRLNSYRLGQMAMLINVYNSDNAIYQQWIFKEEELNKLFKPEMPVFEFEIKNINPVYATVIQSVKDYGVPFIMSGFVMLLVGMAIFLLNKKF